MSTPAKQNYTHNYLFPSAGKTSALTFNQPFPVTPQAFDFRQYSLDNAPFLPQGVFVDNSAGTSPLVIIIDQLPYTISCPAGAIGIYPYPAPDVQSVRIGGDGINNANVIFVDFPVMPFERLSSAPVAIFRVLTQTHITVGTASAALLPLGNYNKVIVQNSSATAKLFINVGAAATVNDFYIAPGGYFEFSGINNAVNAISDTSANVNVIYA